MTLIVGDLDFASEVPGSGTVKWLISVKMVSILFAHISYENISKHQKKTFEFALVHGIKQIKQTHNRTYGNFEREEERW